MRAPAKKHPTAKATSKKPAKSQPPISVTPKPESQLRPEKSKPEGRHRDVGLTVRVEINLPADGNQETYDRIFKSIRENLIDAE